MHKRVVLFLISQNLSTFGTAVVGFTILWHVTLQTSSGQWLMLFTLATMLPQRFTTLFGGVLADRYNRKHLVILADGVAALATLLLIIIFRAGVDSLAVILALSLLRSAGNGFQMPAATALYPQLVEADKLTRVQGINQTLGSLIMLAAPATGGFLLGAVGLIGSFYVDIITAAIAITVMAYIKVDKVARRTAPQSVTREIREGITFTFKDAILRRYMIFYAVTMFLIAPAAVLTPLLIERSFGREVWMLTVNELVWAVGMLLGGGFVALKGAFNDKLRVCAIGVLACGVVFALCGASPLLPAWITPGGSSQNLLVYFIFMGIGGIFLPLINTAGVVYIQETVAPEILGRVFSIIGLIANSAMPVAILLFGPLADIVSVESLLIVSGLLLALTGLAFDRYIHAVPGYRPAAS